MLHGHDTSGLMAAGATKNIALLLFVLNLIILDAMAYSLGRGYVPGVWRGRGRGRGFQPASSRADNNFLAMLSEPEENDQYGGGAFFGRIDDDAVKNSYVDLTFDAEHGNDNGWKDVRSKKN